MANYNAIAATSEAIRRYLKEAPRPEFPQLDVDLFQPSDFKKSVPTGGRVSIFLYRVAVNTSVRNLAPRWSDDGKRRCRPAIPLDLFYMVGAWATNADVQQRLLGWCVRTLEDAPVLPASVLNRLQEAKVFRTTETVELVCDPMSLQDLSMIWELVKPDLPLSISYVARMIALESEMPLGEGELAQTRAFEMRTE